MKKNFAILLVCVLSLTSLFAQTLSVDAKRLNADVSLDYDISEMDLNAVTSADNSSTRVVYGIHHGVAVSASTNGAARITKGIFTHLKDIGACS